MTPTTACASLGLAIVFEVCGTTLLQKSEQFTRLLPTLGTIVFYLAAFYFLSQSLKVVPLGVAYASWAGLGIVLTALIGVFYFRQPLDWVGVMGIVLIVAGAILVNGVSGAKGH